MMDMFKSMQQQSTAQTAHLANALAGQQSRVEQAYKDQANQARDMSQTAMNSMGQVAASRASGGFAGQAYTQPQQSQQPPQQSQQPPQQSQQPPQQSQQPPQQSQQLPPQQSKSAPTENVSSVVLRVRSPVTRLASIPSRTATTAVSAESSVPAERYAQEVSVLAPQAKRAAAAFAKPSRPIVKTAGLVEPSVPPARSAQVENVSLAVLRVRSPVTRLVSIPSRTVTTAVNVESNAQGERYAQRVSAFVRQAKPTAAAFAKPSRPTVRIAGLVEPSARRVNSVQAESVS